MNCKRSYILQLTLLDVGNFRVVNASLDKQDTKNTTRSVLKVNKIRNITSISKVKSCVMSHEFIATTIDNHETTSEVKLPMMYQISTLLLHHLLFI